MTGWFTDFFSYVFTEGSSHERYAARQHARRWFRRSGQDYSKARQVVMLTHYMNRGFKRLVLQQLAVIYVRELRRQGKYPPAALSE